MLKNLRKLNGDCASALGPKFKMDEVLAISLRVLSAFRMFVTLVHPGAKATYRLGHDGPYQPLVDPSELGVIEAGFKEAFRQYDADSYPCRMEVGPYGVILKPFGDNLFDKDDGLKTIDGKPGEELDNTPLITVFRRSHLAGILTGEQWIEVVAALMPHVRADGLVSNIDLKGAAQAHAELKFPHGKYGVGEGALIIRVV